MACSYQAVIQPQSSGMVSGRRRRRAPGGLFLPPPQSGDIVPPLGVGACARLGVFFFFSRRLCHVFFFFCFFSLSPTGGVRGFWLNACSGVRRSHGAGRIVAAALNLFRLQPARFSSTSAGATRSLVDRAHCHRLVAAADRDLLRGQGSSASPAVARYLVEIKRPRRPAPSSCPVAAPRR